MKIDVTDQTFEAEVVQRSHQTPVVVDLWASWCQPCQTLGPIIERVVDETAGRVVLAKVDVDANQATAQAFRVQGIPAVHAMVDGVVVDSFQGAQPEQVVREFVDRLLPSDDEVAVDKLVAAGDEDSLRQALDLIADHPGAVLALAELLIAGDEADEGLELLGRISESPDSRRLAALARTGDVVGDADIGATLDGLLSRVKDDEVAKAQFLDLLERMGPDDPRTADYRRKLTAQLF